MFNTAILDVAIGMIFVYLLLSLMCSAANEVIELWLKNRAVDLERGLRELLRESASKGETTAEPGAAAKANNGGLVERLYSHPLVYGLFEGQYDRSSLRWISRLKGRVNLPSYIPARSFALALMDTVVPGVPADAAATSGAAGAMASAHSAPPSQIVVNAGQGPTPVVTVPPGPPPDDPLKRLRDGIKTIPNKDVQQALVTLVDAAGKDVAKARENIEEWYNSSMDRVSGWYKRRSQYIILVIGFIVTIAVNADSITIAKRLSTDRSLRESLVAAADAYAKANASPTPASAPVVSPTPPPAASPTPTPDPCWENDCKGKEDSPQCKLKKSQCAIQGLNLPIGWNPSEEQWPGLHFWYPREFLSRWYPAFRLHLFGWLLTALAVSLGAPFWFDMLNKFVVVRSTVKPKEKSPDEPPKG